MAATLVEIVRHILRDTLHATSVRTELAEVGELLEDVVADFGASIRLRDSAGIAEGRDALMEAVDILDQIVLNYDSEHDEFTMDPATLQDDLLRLAQQLQIVVPAHDNLLGDIRGELPSQRPASNSQELFEGYGDEMGLMQLHRPGTDPSGDTEESHRCAIQLLSVLEREFPESYRTNGQCEADAIWLLLRGERLAEYIDGMNIPAEERERGGEDEHPGLAGTYQNHEGNARDKYRGRQPRQREGAEDHPDDFEPMALIQSQLRGSTTTTTTSPSTARGATCTTTSTTTTPMEQAGGALPANTTATARSRSPTRGRSNQTEPGGMPTPSPVRRARSQASQLLDAIESETQATADYALNAEERGSQQRANYAAEAMDLITEAMGLADDVGIPGVVDYLAATATRLSQLHTKRTRGTNRRGKPLPTPNAFEIAALTVGIMEASSQQGELPSMAELLEVLELVQAGMALLTRGRHSYNWQVTHWATDAAEEALALLSVATATDDPSELGRTPPQLGDLLPRLRNLLEEAATGIGVLVGIYPHWGENEYIHPADTIAQNQHEGEQTLRHPISDPPDALHIYKAQRALRQLHPYLEGEMRALGEEALNQLGAWIQSHWGEDVQLLSSDEEAAPQQSREEPAPERGRPLPATVLDGGTRIRRFTLPTTYPTPTASAAGGYTGMLPDGGDFDVEIAAPGSLGREAMKIVSRAAFVRLAELRSEAGARPPKVIKGMITWMQSTELHELAASSCQPPRSLNGGLVRAFVRYHHVQSLMKRSYMRMWAEDLGVAALLAVGQPGMLLAVGPEGPLKAFLDRAMKMVHWGPTPARP
ncbi:hypothetical protein AK812_SmicGene21460 [Symbiodinium microadriaticum]|uniref:Uncharacterized protein n=2 Tax=Symbiodinium TaxID=2949 RepID=A0A1Q9DMD9_SYMMI|nr:hypothetical protein AK812_SmicGene21460 [Symbiodinium microadriaticum]